MLVPAALPPEPGQPDVGQRDTSGPAGRQRGRWPRPRGATCPRLRRPRAAAVAWALLCFATHFASCGSQSPTSGGTPGATSDGFDEYGLALADSSLRAAVVAALTEAGLSDPDSLPHLDAGARGIADLAGIGQLTGLTSLNLSGNRIGDISPLATLWALELLDLGNNHVEDVRPLAALDSLRVLMLDANSIVDISPLVDLAELTDLELAGNPLDSASLRVVVPAMRERGIVVALGPTDEPVTPEPDTLEPLVDLDGRVAFVAESDLFVVGLQDARLVQITDAPESDGYPSWSPDGRRLAFMRGGDIFVVGVTAAGADGLTSLTNGEGQNSHPAWSPDGTRIAFTRSTPTTPRNVYVMDANGSNLARLTDHDWSDSYASWHPSGRRILYICRADGEDVPQVYSVTDAGSDVQQHTNDNISYKCCPQWSDDGSMIAFAGQILPTGHVRGVPMSVWTLHANTGDLVAQDEGWGPISFAAPDRLLYTYGYNDDEGVFWADSVLLDTESGRKTNLAAIMRERALLKAVMCTDAVWTPVGW